MKNLIIIAVLSAICLLTSCAGGRKVTFVVKSVHNDTITALRKQNGTRMGEIFVIKGHNKFAGDTLTMIATKDWNKVNVITLGRYIRF